GSDVCSSELVPKMQFTFGLLTSFPEDKPSDEGFTLIADHYTVGEIAPVNIIVDTEGEDVSLQEKLEAHPLVERVEDAVEGTNKDSLKKWQVTLSIDPYATEAVNSIPELQEIAFNALDEASVTNVE